HCGQAEPGRRSERPAEEVLDPQQVQQVERDAEDDAVSTTCPAASAVQQQAEAGEGERSQPPEIAWGVAEVQQRSPDDGERQAYHHGLPAGAAARGRGCGEFVTVRADSRAVVSVVMAGHVS